MKKYFMRNVLFLTVMICNNGTAQDIPTNAQQQLENQAAADESASDDDGWLQEMEQFKKSPLNLNTATQDEIKQLNVLNDLQILSLIDYRNLLGRLISIYELQAIPYWDIALIKKLLPFITITEPFLLRNETSNRFRNGSHTILIRLSQTAEQAKGFIGSGNEKKYAGSPLRAFVRYRYSYKNLLQFGCVGEKDAGEQFFKGNQKTGFDFYSFHLFARKLGHIESFALGDFTVNMGQGLILWQGLAFKKSAESSAIKRQSAVLKPYSSAGEFYFFRGIGLTLRYQKTAMTFFASRKRTDANISIDTSNPAGFISSFATSGYHRSIAELNDRKTIIQTVAGSSIIYKKAGCHVGLNAVLYHFSLPINKRDEPYNLYAVNGKTWWNASCDFSYTWHNLHLFGEMAVDRGLRRAFLYGMLISADPRVDVSLVYRSLPPAYQAINANAFTESSSPSNENGLYAGATVRPAAGWRIDLYGDIYRFPWLKYQADAPGGGKDYLLQITYTPSRQVELSARYRTETKTSNEPDNDNVTNYLQLFNRKSIRVQILYAIDKSISIKNRIEQLWYGDNDGVIQNGFSTFFDVSWKPMMKPFSATARFQYFETGGYDSRIYAYENDALYSSSIPALFDKGIHYYILIGLDLTKKLKTWFRAGRTNYNNKNSIGSGNDEISGHHKTEFKFQMMYSF